MRHFGRAVPAASNSAGTEADPPQSGVRAVAARGPDGTGAVVIARYAEDNNVTATIRVALDVSGADLSRAQCLLTDSVRTCTEVPLEFDDAGAASLRLQPNSFALVEW